jgi:hypothetical protein
VLALILAVLAGRKLDMIAYLAVLFSLLSLFRVVGREDVRWIKGLVRKK